MTAPKSRVTDALSNAAEARIQKGIAADPDNPELTAEDFARAVPASAIFAPAEMASLTAMRRGRGAGRKPAKMPIKLRLDPDIVAAFKADGDGWQTRMNDVLRRSVDRRRKRA